MLGPVDYILWFGSAFLEAGVVVCSLRIRSFKRYLTLNLYMLAAFLLSFARFVVLQRYGFTSKEYLYFYYYSDGLLTILMFFAVMGLYQQVFEEMRVSRYIRGAAIVLLGGTAWFSYMVVNQLPTQFSTHPTPQQLAHFLKELSQNLYFVGVVLTYLLWGAVLKLRETRLRIIQLVLSLGIFFSAYAASYALWNLSPRFAFLRMIPPVLGTLLPLAWLFTFTKIPEEARLATARVAPKRARLADAGATPMHR